MKILFKKKLSNLVQTLTFFHQNFDAFFLTDTLHTLLYLHDFYFIALGHTISLEGKELQRALQYLPTQGLPELVNWLKDLQKEVHRPPLTTDLIVTCGSQDGLCKALEMLLTPGAPVVVEDFIYAGTLAIMVRSRP